MCLCVVLVRFRVGATRLDSVPTSLNLAGVRRERNVPTLTQKKKETSELTDGERERERAESVCVYGGVMKGSEPE